MTNPKRYDIEYHDGQNVIAPDENGDYVRWDDYEVLRGNLSLAEDGLAAATQEIELVRAQRDSNLAKEVETVSRLEAEIGVLKSRLEGSQAAAAGPVREPVAAPIDYQCRKYGSSDVIPWPRAAEKSSEPPPVDNAHVAEGCEKFDE